MRCVILGDLHFGSRVDSDKLYTNQEKFFSKVLFPYLDKHNITRIIQTGDLFDNRLRVNTRTLQFSKRVFFDPLRERNIRFDSIAGNHDAFYKDSLKVVTGHQVLKEYDNVHIYSKPVVVDFDGLKISMIPWICKDNEQEILDFIKDDIRKVCVGHFELMNFKYSKSSTATHGMDAKLLENYELVISGHYHSKSIKGNVNYVGTPTENTWEDCDDGKGFWVLDTDTLEMEFISNPYNLFEIIHLESKDDIKEMKKDDNLDLQHKFVKLLVDYDATDKDLKVLTEYLNEKFDMFDLVTITEKKSQDSFQTVSVKDLASNRELIKKYSDSNELETAVKNRLLSLYDAAHNNMKVES